VGSAELDEDQRVLGGYTRTGTGRHDITHGLSWL
jgi:hypothetical protein